MYSQRVHVLCESFHAVLASPHWGDFKPAGQSVETCHVPAVIVTLCGDVQQHHWCVQPAEYLRLGLDDLLLQLYCCDQTDLNCFITCLS